MSRSGSIQPRKEPKTSDLLIRQKVEAMIELDQVRASVQSWIALGGHHDMTVQQ